MPIYREEGFKLEVQVLRDESDETWERYVLKVLNVLRQSRVVRTPVIGEEFSAQARRDSKLYVGWELEGYQSPDKGENGVLGATTDTVSR